LPALIPGQVSKGDESPVHADRRGIVEVRCPSSDALFALVARMVAAAAGAAPAPLTVLEGKCGGVTKAVPSRRTLGAECVACSLTSCAFVERNSGGKGGLAWPR
jgi:hypothetical protein